MASHPNVIAVARLVLSASVANNPYQSSESSVLLGRQMNDLIWIYDDADNIM